MIGVTFEVPDLKFMSGTIGMPFIPRTGDQIILSDFITVEESDKILKSNNNPDIDSLFVKNVVWMRTNQQKEVYVLLTLFNKL